eukprot:m.11378 g.11378  ORF g.11378 m.11378 type:complete len:369 (-) comp6889_c0_seq1:117-1223(-)
MGDVFDDLDLSHFSMDSTPEKLKGPTPVEEFGGFGDEDDGFGFFDGEDAEDAEKFGGFGVDSLEAKSTVTAEDRRQAEEEMLNIDDETAFGETLGESDDEEDQQIVQTCLNPKFPAASQAFRGPTKDNHVMTSITLNGVQMVSKGSFNIEIRTRGDGKGDLLGTKKNVDASRMSIRKAINFRDPIEMKKNTPYHIHIVLNSGSFKFEVGENKVHPLATGARYRFKPVKSERYVKTGSDMSYLLKTRFTTSLEADPKKGEKSNWLEHTRTAHKKGTVARRLSIRKRHKTYFFVLEGFDLKYYEEVDGELKGLIKLVDAVEVTGDENGLVFVLLMSNCEHTIKCKSSRQSRGWIAALNNKLTAIKEAASG